MSATLRRGATNLPVRPMAMWAPYRYGVFSWLQQTDDQIAETVAYLRGQILQGVTDGSDAAPGQIGEYVRLVAPDINFSPAASETVSVNAGVLPPGDWAVQAYAYVDAAVTGAQFYLDPTPPGLSDSMGAVLALQGQENITLVGPMVRASLTAPQLLSFSCTTNNDGPGTASGVMSVRVNAWRMR